MFPPREPNREISGTHHPYPVLMWLINPSPDSSAFEDLSPGEVPRQWSLTSQLDSLEELGHTCNPPAVSRRHFSLPYRASPHRRSFLRISLTTTNLP